MQESGGGDPKDIIEMERIISRSDIYSTYDRYPTSGAVTPNSGIGTPMKNTNEGVVLDASREVRVKLHMGQVGHSLPLKVDYAHS